MPVTITIDMFSGRRNPTIELDDKAATDVLDRLAPERLVEEGEPLPPQTPTLGYRGLVIEQTGEVDRERGLPRRFRLAGDALLGRGLLHHPRDGAVEDFLCGREGPLHPYLEELQIDPTLLDDLRRRFREELVIPELKFPWFPWPLPCDCGPNYEPDWWNQPSKWQYDNNCYNYATNYRTDTFAQPGEAHGHFLSVPLTATDVKDGALADHLIDAPSANAHTCPPEGHLVALVVYDWDYHWYRRDKRGWWSHKPGGTAVTDRDNSNHMISNPETADRGLYTEFVGYFVLMHGHVKIT